MQKTVHSGVGRVNPVFLLVCQILVAECRDEILTAVSVVKHLFGLEAVQQFLYVIACAFGRQELASGYVKESNADFLFAIEMNGCEEVVFLVIQHIIINRDSWCYEFRDASLDEFFSQFWVFKLVADSDTQSGSDQFRQICVERMVRESGHFCGLRSAVGSFGERYAENLRCLDSVR